MINVSKEFFETMKSRTDFKPSAEITFQNGAVKNVEWTEFTLQNNSIVDGSGTSSFPLGVAIEKTIQIELQNDDDRFSEFDFIGAKIRLWLNYALSETTEKIAYGTFTVRSPETYGETVIITAVDDMYRADTAYETNRSFPVSLGEAVRDVCSNCGLVLQTARFKNDGFVINKKPENITNRQFLAMAAMIACGYARIDYNGRLCINSYDLSAFEASDRLWGGIFDGDTPYSTGDSAFGGTFNPWSVGDTYFGGTTAQMSDYHVLYDFKNIKVDTDDVIITGIQATVDKSTYFSGEEGYVLSIENQLMSGREQEAVNLIGQSIIGLRFRPFTADHIAYPLAEFGDPAYIIDGKQNVYRTILTDVNFTFLNYTTLKCAADSPLRNSSNYASEITKAVVTARRETEEKISDYDLQVQNMTSIMANSMGLFETVEMTESGGRIIYQHDKPTLKESKKIWKKSEQGFMVSQDGGKTWTAGMDASGNAVLNVLSVTGINFSWARGGILALGGPQNGNGVLYARNEDGVITGSITNSGARFIDVAEGRNVLIEKGAIYTALGNNYCGRIGAFYWGDDKTLEGTTFLTYKKYLGIGHDGTSNYVVNNGLNPDGYTEANLFFGNTRFISKTIFNVKTFFQDALALNNSTEEAGGIGRFTNGIGIYANNGRSFLILNDGTTNMSVSRSGINVYRNMDMHNYQILNTSDERLKKNIKESSVNSLSIIQSIQLYDFDWIESEEHEDLGFIAQQLEGVDKSFVDVNQEDGHYSTKQLNLIPYLVKAIQELSQKVDDLKNQISELQGKKVAKKKKQKKKWNPKEYTEEEKLSFIKKMQENMIVFMEQEEDNGDTE